MMTRRPLLLAFAAALTLLPACATKFQGSAHIAPADCHNRCAQMGGTMAAYVYMGDYSTACVCEPARRRADTSGGRTGGIGGAVAGVWMQMQEASQQQTR